VSEKEKRKRISQGGRMRGWFRKIEGWERRKPSWEGDGGVRHERRHGGKKGRGGTGGGTKCNPWLPIGCKEGWVRQRWLKRGGWWAEKFWACF